MNETLQEIVSAAVPFAVGYAGVSAVIFGTLGGLNAWANVKQEKQCLELEGKSHSYFHATVATLQRYKLRAFTFRSSEYRQRLDVLMDSKYLERIVRQ